MLHGYPTNSPYNISLDDIQEIEIRSALHLEQVLKTKIALLESSNPKKKFYFDVTKSKKK